MGKSGRANALLLEIALAILFFALCATVILQCFSAAYEQSSRADVRDRALAEAQNLASALYAAQDFESALVKMGFSEGEKWTRSGEGWLLSVTLDRQAAGAGAMETAKIVATEEEMELFVLPVARYCAGEAVLQ